MEILIPSQIVQPLFSWFSRLPMNVSAWQVWRSLWHTTGCTLRQSLRLWIRWVRHRSWTWAESYSFVIVLGHGQIPILSNKPLDKLEVTLLMWKQERQMCETMKSSHWLRPAMALVRALLKLTVTRVRWWCWRVFLYVTVVFVSLFRGMSLKRLDEFRKKTSVRWIMGRIGKVGREVVKKAWLSVIIKLKLAWLSRSVILPLGTFSWLSLSVIHAKTSLKGLILIILSTYQAW